MVRIIDASVAIKWFVDEAGRERALEVLKDVLHNPRSFAVPELFFFELAHVFYRLHPNPSQVQVQLLSDVTVLGVHRFAMTPELLKETRYYQKAGLSGYDAAYVALAKLLKGKWLTFDAIAHKKVARTKLSELLS
jgi:predicted nucleic acid-binding protein